MTLELDLFFLKTPSSPHPLPKSGKGVGLRHYNTYSSSLPFSIPWVVHFAASISLRARGTARHTRFLTFCLPSLCFRDSPHHLLLHPLSPTPLCSAPSHSASMLSPHSTLPPLRTKVGGCTTALYHSPCSPLSPFPHGSVPPAQDST